MGCLDGVVTPPSQTVLLAGDNIRVVQGSHSAWQGLSNLCHDGNINIVGTREQFGHEKAPKDAAQTLLSNPAKFNWIQNLLPAFTSPLSDTFGSGLEGCGVQRENRHRQGGGALPRRESPRHGHQPRGESLAAKSKRGPSKGDSTKEFSWCIWGFDKRFLWPCLSFWVRVAQALPVALWFLGGISVNRKVTQTNAACCPAGSS